MSTIERLNKELKEINTNPPCNCSAGIIEDDIFKWEASIIGPEMTPYQDGVFQLLIDFPQDYPFKSPKIIFKTPIYRYKKNFFLRSIITKIFVTTKNIDIL